MFNHCPVLGAQPKPVLIRVTWVAHMGGGKVRPSDRVWLQVYGLESLISSPYRLCMVGSGPHSEGGLIRAFQNLRSLEV